MLETGKAGHTLMADAGYDSDRLRAELKRRRAIACIKADAVFGPQDRHLDSSFSAATRSAVR